MNIARFEPDDGTSYRVLLHVLTEDEAEAIGGVSSGSVLFGFSSGAMSPLPVGVFQPSGFLSLDYYAEQMGWQDQWTRLAGYVVLSRLTGRSIETDTVTPILREWHSGWARELASLKRGLIAEQEDRER